MREGFARTSKLNAGLPALVPAGALLALLATNRWVGGKWDGDVNFYERIAAAAPGRPDGPIGSAYSARFGVHWFVGVFSDATGLGLHGSYRVVALLALLGTVFAASRLMGAATAQRGVALVGLMAFVFAPYAGLRETHFTPGGVQDIVFVLGTAVVLLGLVRGRVPLVLAGAALTIAGRQSGLFVAGATVLWILVGSGWRERPRRERLAAAVGVVVLTAAIYATVLAITKPFTIHYAPDSLADTVIGSPPSAHDMLSHLGRCAIALVLPAAGLATLFVLLRRGGVRIRSLPREIWLSLLMAAVVIGEPVVVSPDFPGFAFNEQRLVGIGILPVALALALTLDVAVRHRLVAVRRPWLAGVAALLFLGSLHHVFTWFGPRGPGQFAVLQAFCATGLVLALTVYGRAPARYAGELALENA